MDVRINRRNRVDTFFSPPCGSVPSLSFRFSRKRYVHKKPQSQTESLKKQILLLGSGFGFHVDDLLAIVVTAVLADTVGELHLLAARALNGYRAQTASSSRDAYGRGTLKFFPWEEPLFTPPHPRSAKMLMPKKDFCWSDPSGMNTH